MKHISTKRVAIDRDRLDYMIKTGHGKPISKDRGRKWTFAELESASGINYQHISKIYRGAGGREQNLSTVSALAAAFDVDIEYLTGEQDIPRRTPQDDQEEQRRENVRRITDTVSFVSRYGLRVKLDDPGAPTKYSVYDADDNLIEENADIEELLPLVGMIHNLFLTGRNIVSLYFDGAYLWEE